MSLFSLSTWALALFLFGIVIAATVGGNLFGRSLRSRSKGQREPFGVLQAAMLGFMALVLAFGLSLAVGRYENRRAAVVDEANALGTAYLRAQTIAEPERTPSLDLLRQLTDVSVDIAETVPGSPEQLDAIARGSSVQGALWDRAGRAVSAAPTASAPRLYLDSLNTAFDAQSTRIYGLGNRVPTPVLLLEIVGAAIALGLLALHLGALGRGPVIAMFAALLVGSTLYITFDLDRPVRGLINVPADPLTNLRVSMDKAPAYGGPS